MKMFAGFTMRRAAFAVVAFAPIVARAAAVPLVEVTFDPAGGALVSVIAYLADGSVAARDYVTLRAEVPPGFGITLR